MDVIALVYSLAVLVWVIICLVSGNSQFGGTGSLAAYITFILDQVSRSQINSKKPDFGRKNQLRTW
jgi:hypothetical protein